MLILISEIAAQHFLGLGKTPLYMEDPQFEYIYKPDQKMKRFSNLIYTNEYSMRSKPLKQGEIRVLLFGDSVLNGGSLTDQSELATTLLEEHLETHCPKNIRVLNISAGSWGPDNAYAYLTKYGDFNATEFILVFSSHDAHDNMKHEKIVGLHSSYPSTQPFSALTEGFTRYFIPRLKRLFFSTSEKKTFEKINKIETGEKFNSGWNDFLTYSKSHNIKLSVVIHPDKNEIVKKEYNRNGEQIIEFLKANNVPYILELEKTTLQNYRDSIHYNKKGQKFLFSEILPVLLKDVCNSNDVTSVSMFKINICNSINI